MRDETCSKRTERSVDFIDTDKHVSFKGRVRILKIPGRSSFTKQEKESMWYTKDEIVELVDKRCDAVAMMIREDDGTHSSPKRGQDEYKVAVMPKRRSKSLQGTETSNECTDGLRSRHEYKICKVVVQEALNEVLLEQEIQWKENMSDPEHLADVYFEYTRHNQRQAVERGRRLALEVERDNHDGSDGTKENGIDGVSINPGKTTTALPDRRGLQMFLASMDGALMEKYCLTKSRRKGMKRAERRRMILEEAMELVSSAIPDDGTHTVASSSCPCSQESHTSTSSSSSASSVPSQANTSRSSNSKWNDDASGDHTPRPPPRRK